MRRGIAKVAAIGTLVAVPAVALADSTTYTDASIDGTASIELKITDGDDRKVKRVVARKLPYSGGLCIGTGRTGRIVVKGTWRVRENDEFKVVGAYDGGDNPIAGGELKVVGDAGSNKVTGNVKFTYGKDGCTTDKLSFTAK
ncbi:MAG: hypothetical protein M3Y34_07105 [Actinomycetota bacterium]|nr:hypothetical protein [Actinomycetota bacterium]